MVDLLVSDDWIFVEMRAEVKPQSLVTVEVCVGHKLKVKHPLAVYRLKNTFQQTKYDLCDCGVVAGFELLQRFCVI